MKIHAIHIRSARALLVPLAAVAFVGCASQPPAPSEQMAVSEAALTRANTEPTRAGAGVQLQVATQKLAQARTAQAAGDMALARRLAEAAEVDAQLAEVQAQSARSRRAAADSEDAARVLREELNRKTVR